MPSKDCEFILYKEQIYYSGEFCLKTTGTYVAYLYRFLYLEAKIPHTCLVSGVPDENSSVKHYHHTHTEGFNNPSSNSSFVVVIIYLILVCVTKRAK